MFQGDLTLFVPTLSDSSRVPGGADLPTFELLPWEGNFNFFLDRVLALDVKGQNLKAQLSTLKTVALIFLRQHAASIYGFVRFVRFVRLSEKNLGHF